MDLQISVFLLFFLFNAGHSLKCYECKDLTGSCANKTEKTCPSGSSKCMTATTVAQAGTIKLSTISKMCAPACESGTQEVPNVGTVTFQCCDTDLCNAADGVYKGSFLLLLSPLLFYFLFQ